MIPEPVLSLIAIGLSLVTLGVLLWLVKKTSGKGQSEAVEQWQAKTMDSLSQLRFAQEELQKQLRNVSQEMENRQAAQAQNLQQAMSQARTEGQQAQSALQQLVISQFGQGNQ
ncbi:MAG: hypothetical protein R3194_03465, partial [Limnobacter sp.]|nr:hypothetical protein [Limnobacter sp.]